MVQSGHALSTGDGGAPRTEQAARGIACGPVVRGDAQVDARGGERLRKVVDNALDHARSEVVSIDIRKALGNSGIQMQTNLTMSADPLHGPKTPAELLGREPTLVREESGADSAALLRRRL